MRIKWVAAMVMVCGVLGMTATPSDARPVRDRMRQQQGRIAQGVRQGDLTPHEWRRLERQEARVAALERRLRLSDGRITPGERRRLQGALDRLSGEIYRQRHDRQRW